MADEIPARTVDEYLMLLDAPTRELLTDLREAILTSAPKAEELISYRVPTYKQNGALVHFAAFKNHCSLVVANKEVIDKFSNELKLYRTSGTTIHFTREQPLPAALVKKIVKMRIVQNEALKKKKPGKV
jgi:uncharacterized protein YdhG (YjbR/CyaY superfamily)